MKHPIKTTLLVLSLSILINLYYSGKSFSLVYSKNLTANSSDKDLREGSGLALKTQIKLENNFLSNIIKTIKSDYVEIKTDDDLARSAANGILSSLDPHSAYLSENDFKEMKVQTRGEFGGVGIEITTEKSLIKVVSPIEGTPAYKAGIKAGDYITKIDNKSAIDITLEEAVKKLRGKPNSKVKITILRKNNEGPLDFTIKREIIKIKSVRSEAYKDIAYIKINSFSSQAYSDLVSNFKNLLNTIGKENLKGIVLDLRNNPGGLLDQSVKVSDFFLDKDQLIVSIKGRRLEKNEEFRDASDQGIIKDLPVVVLINEGSASASEIVAGALQDNNRALILGQKSFGKGSVQSIIPLKKNQGAIKMTTALYYTPSGKSIQAKGIEPDVLLTDAKIEKTDKTNVLIRSESFLNGHLENKDKGEQKRSQVLDENIDIYNDDYQLARALDLIRGISFYKKLSHHNE